LPRQKANQAATRFSPDRQAGMARRSIRRLSFKTRASFQTSYIYLIYKRYFMPDENGLISGPFAKD
jgi:hypothetical protein